MLLPFAFYASDKRLTTIHLVILPSRHLVIQPIVITNSKSGQYRCFAPFLTAPDGANPFHQPRELDPEAADFAGR